MTIQLLGVAGWTNEMKQFYEKDLLARAKPRFHYVGHGIKRAIPKNGGKSLEWRRLNRPAAATTALTEGTPPTETQTTWSNAAATISQYGAYVKISDVAQFQSFDQVMPEHSEMFSEQMADTLDIIARNVLVAGTNVQYADSAGSRGALTAGNLLDEAEVRKALRNLKRRNARPMGASSAANGFGGGFMMITSPDAVYDLLSDTTIQNVLQNAGARGSSNPYFSGDAFSYLGVNILETTNVPALSGGGLSLAAAVHVYQTVMFGEGAYGESEYTWDTMEIIVKPVGSGGTSDPLNQFGTVGWKAAYTAAILDQNFLQRIEHAVSNNELPVSSGYNP